MRTFTQALVAAAIVASSFSIYAQDLDLKPAVDSVCNPSVTIQHIPFSPMEDYGMTIGEVHAQNQESSHLLTLQGTGVGAVKASTALYVHYSTVNNCPRVTIEYGLENVNLYVPREFRGNQCAFDHILQHERGHLTLYRQWLLQSQYRIKEKLDAAASMLIGYESWQNEAIQIVGEEFKTIQHHQHEYDSENEYDKNNTVCNRAIPRILKRHGFSR